MANNPNDDRLMNFFPLTDKDILARWSVDDLDMLHRISGLGEEWMASDRRAELKKIEDDEVERLRHIVEDIRLESDENG